MIKWPFLLFLTMPLITNQPSIASEALIKRLEQIESEERLSKKLIYLHWALNQNEQIRALDKAIQERSDRSGDSDLSKQLKASRELIPDQRIATLYYLLPSQEKQIKALTKTLLEKIETIKAEESDYLTTTDAGY